MVQCFLTKYYSSKGKLPVDRIALDLDEEGAASRLAAAKKKLETSQVYYESRQSDLENERTFALVRLAPFCS
jgi:hypothetical protein